MINVNISQFQYDIGIKDGFDNSYYDKFFEFDRTAIKENGHLEYILKIYSTGALLDSNTNQAYHPPLNHIISASFIKILDLFGANNEFKIEALEFPPFVYSILILIFFIKIMREIGFSNKQIIMPLSLITFNPLMIFMSRLINNDQLVILFSLISILYLMKWYKNTSYKNTIILALAIGLGGMTKVSIAVMAIPLVFVYLKKLNASIDDSKMVKTILLEGVIFSAISLPLLFWYIIRNAIKFGQAPFGIATAMDTLKVASTGFADRWILNNEFFDNTLYLNASNVWAYIINSSVMFMMNIGIIPKTIAIILKILVLIVFTISLISILSQTKKELNKNLLYILITTYFSWIIGFIYFNISLPYSCTMHARYLVIPIIIGIIYIGILNKNIKKSFWRYLLNILIIVFEVVSIAFVIYIMMKLKLI